MNINQRIIKGINDNAKDENQAKFLKSLLMKEAEQSGAWRWKEHYRNEIRRYTHKRRQDNANN